jgi:hypothetical protein
LDIHQAEIKILSASGLVAVDGDQVFAGLERRPAFSRQRKDIVGGNKAAGLPDGSDNCAIQFFYKHFYKHWPFWFGVKGAYHRIEKLYMPKKGHDHITEVGDGARLRI